MLIKPEHFLNGGEVDCKVDWKEDCRISIRKSDKYEVIKYYFFNKGIEVVKAGTLQECVDFTNVECLLDDVVEE